MSQTVHQIRYAWSESSLLGTRGMGPVESTLPTGTLAEWDRCLRDHVWAAEPEPGFTYIARDDIGMLLRKVATGAADGRPGSAARVLLSSEMTAREALGLTAWPGWEDPELVSFDWSEMEPSAERGLSELRSRARATLADRLAALFAQVLSAPGESYTVIGEPDPLALVCALGDLTGETPTFASDETDDTGKDLPTVVFLRNPPGSRAGVARRRLNAAVPAADQDIAGFATAVVDAYIADGPEGVVGIRPERPPTDLAEVLHWARHGQFAPGVIADLTRLPRLSERLMHGLTSDGALDKLTAASGAASDTELVAALDKRLPGPVLLVLVREALSRVSGLPSEHPLFVRLVQVGPLRADLVAKHVRGGFDHLIRVSRHLLSADDRRHLIEGMAADIQLAALIRSIAEHADADQNATIGMYSALCGRARELSKEDLRVLASQGALADAVRRFADDDRQASAYIMTLLRALPKGLGSGLVAELAAHPDPVLLHAMDTLITDPDARAIVHRRIRQVYYHEHNLPEPPPTDFDDNQSSRRFPLRRQSSHGKHK